MSPREVSGCRAALLKGFSRVFLLVVFFFLLVASSFKVEEICWYPFFKFLLVFLLVASSFKVEEIWWYPVFKCQNKNLGISFLRC